MTITSRTVMCQGAPQSRPAVELESAAPDSALAGAPALPFESARILLPPGKTAVGVRLAARKYEQEFSLAGPMVFNNQPYDGYDMTDPDQARAWAAENREDPDIYGADAWYPANPVSYTERNFRGYRILEVKFTPFLYHPLNNLLQFARFTALAVDLRDIGKTDAGLACRGLAADRQAVQRLVVNPEAVADYPVAGGARRLNDGGPGVTSNKYYVIITPSAFAPAFEPLRAYHSYDTNHQAAIVTTETIYDYYPNPSISNHVKIQDYVCQVLYSNGCEYLLIGGDSEQVPTYYGESDLYFSRCQFPVGRFSAENTADLSNCMAKAMQPVPNGADKVMLMPRNDEYGPVLYACSNLFSPYLTVDTDNSLYGGMPGALYAAMDTHTILWGRGHGYYLFPHWHPLWYRPDNHNIQPFGINFGCQGCVVDWNTPQEHPAEIYHRAQYGNAAYVGTVEDVTATSFDQEFFRSYFVDGTASPAVGDMMLVALSSSTYYTLLGDPMYEIVSPQFKAMPRITLPSGESCSRSYNTDQGSGAIEDVVFRVVSFNHCGWLITNLTYSDSSISNHIAFSCLSSNQPTDVHMSFLSVTNILAGSYTVTFDIWDTTNNFFRQTKSIYLYVTDQNILTDDDFINDGNRKILPAGEYHLVNQLVVTAGTTLELQPGVILRTATNQILIETGASIKALGNVTNQIRFYVPTQIAGADLMPLSGDFRYCFFSMGNGITATNRPTLDFLNCTFVLAGSGPSSPPLFTSEFRGRMTNCLITAGPMRARGPVGDLSGMDVRYCAIAPDYPLGPDALPTYPTHSREILWGNDFLWGDPPIPRLGSTCINTGDPDSPPDPDGTRADIGAFYHDLSAALCVPRDYATIQAAIDAAATAGCDVAIVVSNGLYQEALTLPNVSENTVRIIGGSETNRPILCLTNHPGNLVTFNGNAFFENLILRHTGAGGLGRTVSMGADGSKIGFKNCEFSGNRDNESVLCVDVPPIRNYGVCLYMWHTDFVNNPSNKILVDLREAITSDGGRMPWCWIRDCRFTNNTDNGTLFFFGSSDRVLFMRELSFIDNSAQWLFHNAAAGLSVTSTTLFVENALVRGNSGEILAENTGHTLFENCTFYNNASNMTAAGFARLMLRNSIVWDNSMALTTSLGGNVSVDFTDINASFPGLGTGNLNTDPLFVGAADGDFHLQRTSPCIDAGDANSPCSNEPYPNGQCINMGRYGNTPEAENWRMGVPITNIVLGADGLAASFPATSNGWYGIECASSLRGPWTNAVGTQATGDTIRVVLPMEGNQGFLRIFNYRP